MRRRRRRRCSCIIARHMTQVNGCAWGQVHTRAFPSQLDKNESPTRAQFLHPHPWSHLAPQAPAVAAHPRETEPSNTPPHQRRQEPTGVAVDAREGGGKAGWLHRNLEKFVGDLVLGNIARGETLVSQWATAFSERVCRGVGARGAEGRGVWLCRQLDAQEVYEATVAKPSSPP